ncbi:MAG TPA: hypothetical protein VFE47_25530 [Tepidisphaeraceae bacterium]|nr:hypothetical protein [Tepidisphaeraceae bacterium]
MAGTFSSPEIENLFGVAELLMQVYKIFFEVDSYQFLLPLDLRWIERFPFDGARYEGKWEPPIAPVRQPRKKAPDIWSLFNDATFGLNAKAMELLKPVLPGSEFLPVEVQGKTVHFVNLPFVDCLDQTKSTFDRKIMVRVMKPVFDRKKLTLSAFRIHEQPRGPLYVTEGAFPEREEFKKIVDANKLTGVYFVPIWPKKK